MIILSLFILFILILCNYYMKMSNNSPFCVDNVIQLEKTGHLPLCNFKYSKVLRKSTRKDESDVYGCCDPTDQFPSSPVIFPESVNTSFDILCHYASSFGDRPHLGTRRKMVQPDGSIKFGEYVWTTYNDSVNFAKIIGTALKSEVLNRKVTIDNCNIVKEMYPLGLWAINCPYWLLTDYASTAYGFCTVSMYESLGDEALIKIITTTKMYAVCIDSKKISILERLLSKLNCLETLVIFDEVSVEDHERLKRLGLRYYLMDDLIERYKNKVVEPPHRKDTDIASIIYTSGTSGIPKGAIYDNRGIIMLIRRLLSVENRILIRRGITFLSYLPLAHVYERFVEHLCSAFLAKIGYFGGNIKLLLDDIKTLKPDIFIGVPRVFTKILQKIRTGIESKPSFVKKLISSCVQKKKKLFSTTPESTSNFFCDLLLNKIKKEFGGKLDIFVLGSAAMLDSDILDLQAYLSCPVSEGYGSTEVGILFVQNYRDTIKGTIGGPLYDIEFKLRSIEQLEYDACATPPRGELLVKGTGFMLGYLAEPNLTAEVMEDGWFKTGDVVELLDNLGLKILDRARNIFKLSQGEYVVPDKLENAYINSPLVEQIYIHGQSTESHIVGVVVLSPDEVLKWADNNGLSGKNVSDLLDNEKLKDEIRSQFDKIANLQNFNSLERLKHFILTDQMFTTENGLMTPTFKTVRHKIKLYYEDQIKSLYDCNKNETDIVYQ